MTHGQFAKIVGEQPGSASSLKVCPPLLSPEPLLDFSPTYTRRLHDTLTRRNLHANRTKIPLSSTSCSRNMSDIDDELFALAGGEDDGEIEEGEA